MNSARQFATQLRTDPNVTTAMIVRAADAIDLLLDIIEGQRGFAGPGLQVSKELRDLRGWHRVQEDRAARDIQPAAASFHRKQVAALNQYFPEGDKL